MSEVSWDRQGSGPRCYELYTGNWMRGGLRDGSSSFMNRLRTNHGQRTHSVANTIARQESGGKPDTHRKICMFTSDLNTTNRCVLSCVSTSAHESHRSFGQYAQWNHSPEMWDMHRSQTANA